MAYPGLLYGDCAVWDVDAFAKDLLCTPSSLVPSQKDQWPCDDRGPTGETPCNFDAG